MSEIAKTAVGFIGLGNMGQPMVRRLAAAGTIVHVFDLSPDAVGALGAVDGVHAANDLSAVAAAADTIILMLPDSAVVNAVVWGRDPVSDSQPTDGALASAMRPGSVVVDMSSSFPLATRELGIALSTRDLAMVDAPVSGGVAKAVTGELAIMAGGEPAVVDRIAPLLEPMGTVYRAGGLSAGHAAKALNNFVSAAGLIAASEALVVGEAFGLEPQVLVEILNASTGRNNATVNKAERFMLSEAYDSGFAYALMQKDVGMARRLADELGLDMPGLKSVSAQLDATGRVLDKSADHTEVHRVATAQLGKKS